MSTKAYNGMFVPDPDLTFTQVLDLRSAIAELALPVRIEHERARLGEDAAITLVRTTLGLHVKNPLDQQDPTARDWWVHAAVQAFMDRRSNDPLTPESADLIVWSVPGRGLLLHVHVIAVARLADDYTQPALDAGLALDWAYWNNSDRPKHVDEHTWDQRAIDWSAAFDHRRSVTLPLWESIALNAMGTPDEDDAAAAIAEQAREAICGAVIDIMFSRLHPGPLDANTIIPRAMVYRRAIRDAVRADDCGVTGIVGDIASGTDRTEDLRAAADDVTDRAIASLDEE